MSTTVIQGEPTGPVAPQAENKGDGNNDDLILGKFKSQDDLIQAYQELERKQGGQDQTDDQNGKEQADNPTDQANDEAAEEALQVAGLDMADFTAEFQKDGKLSEDSYSKLAAAGFPKEVVDTYIQGVQAGEFKQEQMKAEEQTALKQAGIEDWDAVSTWASANLSDQERDTFNRILESGDVGSITWALENLNNKYLQANGQPPSLIEGEGGQVQGDVYRSKAEMLADMRDPRYKSDPAFRGDVIAKTSRTKKLGG